MGGLDITVEAWLESPKMREDGFEAVRISRGTTCDLYWTLAQMVAHHTSNGCNLKPADLIATGTISGTEKESRGCLIERTWRGSEPFTLPTDETRSFLQDGDTVILKAFCEKDGMRVGFGECRGTIIA
jgi:fumarylacetoacetase